MAMCMGRVGITTKAWQVRYFLQYRSERRCHLIAAIDAARVAGFLHANFRKQR